jgi:crotonyl-CoA carboxylase/reductase
VFSFEDIPQAHMKMWKNEHPPGNMAVMVNAPRTGLKNFDDVVEAAGQ